MFIYFVLIATILLGIALISLGTERDTLAMGTIFVSLGLAYMPAIIGMDLRTNRPEVNQTTVMDKELEAKYVRAKEVVKLCHNFCGEYDVVICSDETVLCGGKSK